MSKVISPNQAVGIKTELKFKRFGHVLKSIQFVCVLVSVTISKNKNNMRAIRLCKLFYFCFILCFSALTELIVIKSTN